MQKSIVWAAVLGVALGGCGPQNDNASANDAPSPAQKPATQSDAKKLRIDWESVDSKITPADMTTYRYPFEATSVAAQNYAKAFDITPQQAVHSMTVAMASPEVLGKVLDQIQGHYLGHSLTDGANVRLIVYTDDRVEPSDFAYVFADRFGEGLVLPVAVMPLSQAKKPPQVDMRAAGGQGAAP